MGAGGSRNVVTFAGSPSFAPAVPARGAGLSATDLAFVRQKRACRASWQAIAQMLGLSEHDLRRQCDASYVPPPWLARPVAGGQAEPPAMVRRGTDPSAAGRKTARPMRAKGESLAMALKALTKKAMCGKGLGAAIGVSQPAAHYLLRKLASQGLVHFVPGPFGAQIWTLTEAGQTACDTPRPLEAE